MLLKYIALVSLLFAFVEASRPLKVDNDWVKEHFLGMDKTDSKAITANSSKIANKRQDANQCDLPTWSERLACNYIPRPAYLWTAGGAYFIYNGGNIAADMVDGWIRARDSWRALRGLEYPGHGSSATKRELKTHLITRGPLESVFSHNDKRDEDGPEHLFRYILNDQGDYLNVGSTLYSEAQGYPRNETKREDWGRKDFTVAVNIGPPTGTYQAVKFQCLWDAWYDHAWDITQGFGRQYTCSTLRVPTDYGVEVMNTQVSLWIDTGVWDNYGECCGVDEYADWNYDF